MNKDLAEAILMLVCITLVLVGTTEFETETHKTILMGALGCLAVIMGIFRFFGKRKHEDKEENIYN